MSLHTNGVLTLATVPFNLIDDGTYTAATADPNAPNTLEVQSKIGSNGQREILVRRKLWLPQTTTDVGAYYIDYRVMRLPKHSSLSTAVVKGTGDQLFGLNTNAFIDAMRRGEC